MRRSGRTSLLAVLPLLLLGCTDPVVNLEEPEEVETCEWLLPVAIELVNDYVYTLEDMTIGATGGDTDALPPEIVTLNARGEQLDSRAAELDCDIVLINEAVVAAIDGLESDDPVVRVFLESVRGGVIAPLLPTHGEWLLEIATIAGGTLVPLEEHPISLTLERDSASGFAGCNGYFYPVRLADGIWTWTEGAATITELACTDDVGATDAEVMRVEQAFVDAFELVAAYALDGDTLILTGDGVELRFARSAGG